MRVVGNSSDEGPAPASLGWAVIFLDVCVGFSMLRTLEYLNVPVWDWVGRLAHAISARVVPN